MGWWYSHEDTKNYSRKELALQQFDPNYTVLYAYEHGSAIYVAVRSPSGDVSASVVLTHIQNNEYCNFGTKFISETMGPCYYDAPKKLLDMLTPTDSQWALEWRKTCREKIEEHKVAHEINLAKLPYGTIIELHDKDRTRLVVYEYRGRKVYKFVDKYMRESARQIYTKGFHIVKGAE